MTICDPVGVLSRAVGSKERWQARTGLCSTIGHLLRGSGDSNTHALLAALENAGYPAQLAKVESVAIKKTSGCGGNAGGCCCE